WRLPWVGVRTGAGPGCWRQQGCNNQAKGRVAGRDSTLSQRDAVLRWNVARMQSCRVPASAACDEPRLIGAANDPNRSGQARGSPHRNPREEQVHDRIRDTLERRLGHGLQKARLQRAARHGAERDGHVGPVREGDMVFSAMFTTVPEPGTWALLLTGLLAIG